MFKILIHQKTMILKTTIIFLILQTALAQQFVFPSDDDDISNYQTATPRPFPRGPPMIFRNPTQDHTSGFTLHHDEGSSLNKISVSLPNPIQPSQSVNPIPNSVVNNISDIRGTPEYEQYVDNIISNGIARLTLAIDKALSATVKNNVDNVVFAPVSIAAALALLMLGSNGKSFQEITNVMGLTAGVNIETKSQIVHEQFGRLIQTLQRTSGFQIGSQVNFATALFVQDEFPIRSIYKSTAERTYQSEVLNLNFKSNPTNAQQVINAWVSDRTKGKIPIVLGEPPLPTTKVILASAMYFKAEWEFPFFDGTTRSRPFYTNGKNSKSEVMAEMMSNGGAFPYYKDDILNCDVMGFPYKGNQTTMYVVKPFDSDVTKLRQLESILTPGDLARLVSSTRYTDAVLVFPKMRIDSTVDLRTSLESMGVKSIFDPAEANFALLSPGEGAPVSQGLPSRVQAVEKNPIQVESNDEDLLIFSRMGEVVNCTQIFDPTSNISSCKEVVIDDNSTSPHTVTYKKFGDKVGRRITRRVAGRPETLDGIRQYLNADSNANLQNPGLYVDRVIHKVYMDITESGTEAAAATLTSLSRDGGRVTFRVDVPFFFFIWHEETKMILFWGSVNTPTPNTPIKN